MTNKAIHHFRNIKLQEPEIHTNKKKLIMIIDEIKVAARV